MPWLIHHKEEYKKKVYVYWNFSPQFMLWKKFCVLIRVCIIMIASLDMLLSLIPEVLLAVLCLY